jgi:biotin transporter BioY
MAMIGMTAIIGVGASIGAAIAGPTGGFLAGLLTTGLVLAWWAQYEGRL